MPRIGADDMTTHNVAGNFAFTAVRLDRLGATEYTLVTIAVDTSGSVNGFEDSLLRALQTAVKSCKKSPRSDNLLLRVITFSTRGGVTEIHGFKPLSGIDPDKDYPPIVPYGGTPLFDASYSAVAAMVHQGKQLTQADFLCNGIVFIITDGEENTSKATAKMIKDELARIGRAEEMESLLAILIGVNVDGMSMEKPGKTIREVLEKFKKDAGLSQFIDAGDATVGKLAKLADFVSQSVSSQSQAVGTGGPSQNVSTTI